MRPASDVGAADDDIKTALPDVAGLSLRELHLLRGAVKNSALELVLSRLMSSTGEAVSPFGSYLP